MDRALYVAMTGASATLRAQSLVSHNLANASTTGFKAGLLRQAAVEVEGPGFAARFNTLVGDGGFDASGGALQSTGNDLDIALADSNWLAVEAPDGSEAYTRNGALRLTPEGRLIAGSGHVVLGDDGPIAIPPHQKLTIGSDGTISIVPLGQGPETSAVVARLRIVAAEPGQLERGLDGLMRAVPGTPPAPAAGTVLATGVLENSNVNPADALVQIIALSRQFELQVRAIRTADENARAATTLLRQG